MPSYVLRCETDGDFEEWRSIHEDLSTVRCPTCDVRVDVVLQPPMLSVDATPNRSDDARRRVAAESQLEGWVHMDSRAEAYVRRWWPGPLTLILHAMGGGTLGVRIPKHKVALIGVTAWLSC